MLRIVIDLIVIASLASLVSCVKQERSPLVYIDPVFKPFLEQFIVESKSYGVAIDTSNLSIVLSDISEEGVLGSCELMGRFKTVKISRSFLMVLKKILRPRKKLSSTNWDTVFYSENIMTKLYSQLTDIIYQKASCLHTLL